MILYNNEYRHLKSHLEKNSGMFSAILVKGDYGKGKTFLIKQVLESFSNEFLNICQYPGMDTPFEAISTALYQKLEEGNYNIADINSEISHREYIKQLFINICKQTPDIIILFHDVSDYELNSVELMKEIVNFLKIHKIACHIIVEYSTDSLSKEQYENLFTCTSFCTSPEMKLDSKNAQIYKEYFYSLLPGEIEISTSKVDNIIEEAFYNPAYLKKMVYYFSDMGIFFQQNNKWYSDELDFKLTAQLFEKNIHQRYEKLDDTLQGTLHKASITGYEINPQLLHHPLGIIKSEENLRRIERLSRLITCTESNYQFENNSVYSLINDKIPLSEKKALHLLVANYLYEKLDSYMKMDSVFALRMLHIIKNHYINAENLEKALHVIGCYIEYAYRFRNYDAALSGINEFLNLSAGRYSYAEQQLRYLEAKIYGILGSYSIASDKISALIPQYLLHGNKYWLLYTEAYFLFNSGKTEKAKEIADDLIEKLDNKHIIDPLLLIKLDILLAGMYHHFGDVRYAARRYEEALANSFNNEMYRKEYYYLLSISNMFLDNELAISKIEKSLQYFKEQQLMISYAKSANNVAISYIYAGNLQKAIQRLEESYEIFGDICSVSNHYPLNNLATIYGCKESYKKAETLFYQALQNDIEPFSVLWISLNIAHCKRKQKKWDECQKILNDVENRISQLGENTFLLQRNYHIARCLLHWDMNDYHSAYESCLKALHIELELLQNNTYSVFLSKLLLQLSEMTKQPFPDIALPYKDSYVNSFCKMLIDTRTHWGNFLFWEM